MTITERLRDSKAVHTAAGAGDLAAEKLREMPEQWTKLRATLNEQVTRYQGDLRENVAKFQARVEVKDLPGAAMSYVTHVGVRTAEVIDELAERGKQVVGRTERQGPPQELR